MGVMERVGPSWGVFGGEGRRGWGKGKGGYDDGIWGAPIGVEVEVEV